MNILITGMSNRITVVVDDELLEQVDEYDDDDNRSETVRELLKKGLEYDEKQREVDRLNRKVAAIQSRREEHQELVEYVEQERQLNREKQSASAVERAKWWLFGRDLNDD
jgi:metal-responsive CopG/Arc/MetJ family transcriptional regulator